MAETAPEESRIEMIQSFELLSSVIKVQEVPTEQARSWGAASIAVARM